MHSFYPRAANGTASGLTNSALHHLLNESIYLVDLTGESLHPPPRNGISPRGVPELQIQVSSTGNLLDWDQPLLRSIARSGYQLLAGT
jgi:hypothetical protein